MSWNPREDDYSSVAFWYQTGKPTFAARTPHARHRTLPNIDRQIVTARGFAPDVEPRSEELPRLEYTGRTALSGASTELRDLPEHFDLQVLWVPGHDLDQPFEIRFTVADKEPLRLLANLGLGPDLGIFQASLDGIDLRDPMDLYAPSIEAREFHLLDFWPDPGEYVLRLTRLGKNHLSSGEGLAIESVRLRERRPRVRDMAHDRDKDWRADPVFYE
jgi:hypothetical protein